ncbi:MAG: hypothetical protein LKJ69_04780 [Lactobacillus sp.]|nr:hypothetical protein [Lactobacillus sp.]MCI2032698.1 hypothetical protein [Lactobacillus sp.]
MLKANILQVVTSLIVAVMFVVLVGDYQTDVAQILENESMMLLFSFVAQVIFVQFLKADFDRLAVSNKALREFGQKYAATAGVVVCEGVLVLGAGSAVPGGTIVYLYTQSYLELWLINIFTILFVIQMALV